MFWQSLILIFASRLTILRSDRLVKKAFLQACTVGTPWWQVLSRFLSEHHFEGLLADGPFYVADAVQSLRDQWYNSVCQTYITKVSFCLDNLCILLIWHHI